MSSNIPTDVVTEDSGGKKRRFRVTRRGFLIGLGSTVGSLAIGVALGRNRFYRFMAETIASGEAGGGGFGAADSSPLTWFEIAPNNQVTIIIPKVEMGQGVHTSIAQIAAEELDVAWEQINVVQGTPTYGPQVGVGTGNSDSVSSTWEPSRVAAATMRTMLATEGAALLGVNVNQVKTAEGFVFDSTDPTNTISYGEIVSQVSEWTEPEEDIVLRPKSEFKLIGKSIPRVDLEAKIRGEAIYGYDMKHDNMLYGVSVHPPTLEGKMISADKRQAESMPGVVKVVIDLDKNFAGVAAHTRQQAEAAASAIEIDWDRGKLWSQEEIEALMDVSDNSGIVIQKEGDGLSAVGDNPTISADYATPFAIHAHLEPPAALVDVRQDSASVYVSTQFPTLDRGNVADATGIDEENIDVTPTYLGGGFGRKAGTRVATEAAILSQAAGQPVHVGWSRPQDMRSGYFRPATRSRLSAQIAGGKIVALNHNHSSGEVAFPFFPNFLKSIMGTDLGSWRGAFNFYDKIPHRQLSTHLADFPVRTSWWRALGLLANTFANESFMDEMAHAAGVDPLQFRLDHLGDDRFGQRMKAVLLKAAEEAGYGAELPEGQAWGVACSTDVGTLVAMIVTASVDGKGIITVHKAVQAIDPGMVINPDGATAQAQGNIVWGLSSALIEEMTVTNGVIRPRNFDGYPLITLDRMPDMDIHFVESSDQPSGMGEPPIGPVAAAVGNAVFNATGARLRQLPMTPERVLAAMI